jgi:hypothetical protein
MIICRSSSADHRRRRPQGHGRSQQCRRVLSAPSSPGFVLSVMPLGVILQGVNTGGIHDALASPAGRHRLARPDRTRAPRRPARQHREQHPGTAGALTPCRGFSAVRAGRAHRRQRRAQSHVRRLVGRVAVAAAALKFSRRATAPGHGDMRDAVLVEGFAEYCESEPLVPRT